MTVRFFCVVACAFALANCGPEVVRSGSSAEPEPDAEAPGAVVADETPETEPAVTEPAETEPAATEPAETAPEEQTVAPPTEPALETPAGPCAFGDMVVIDPEASSSQYQCPAIAVDSSGAAHIAVAFAGGETTLRYWSNASGDWSGAELYATGDVASCALDVAVGPQDEPHIFVRDSVSPLRTAHLTASAQGWQQQLLLQALDAISAEIDASGKAHLFGAADDDLYYIKSGPGHYASARLSDVAPSSYGRLPLVAHGGAMHTAYADSGTGAVNYVQRVSDAWKTEVVNASAGAVDTPALAVDGAGAVHIAWYVEDSHQLKVATNAAGSWTTTTLSGGEAGSTGLAMTTDGAGRPHLAYRATLDSAGYLMHAALIDGEWAISYAPTPAPVDWYNPSLAAGPDGTVHLVAQRGYSVAYMPVSCQ